MNKFGFIPRKIYVEKACLDFPLTSTIIDKLSQVPWQVVEGEEQILADLDSFSDPIGEGKRRLFLARQKGDFIKPCPCTPDYVGCGYYIINLDLNCPIDCSYCILQSYLSRPCITIHVNTEDLFKQLDAFLKRRQAPLRIGTGELGDSLALDTLTGRSRDLIRYFRGKKNVLFELKTKTVNISNIENEEPSENIIIAWSLNADSVVKTDELGSPSVRERISAARRIVKKGFRVAFHFDPIVFFHGWKEEYSLVIDAVAAAVPADRIAWISLGSLRFPKALKDVIQRRHAGTKLLFQEFVSGKDGKYRYFKPIRREQYIFMISKLHEKLGESVPLYFCMEGKNFWRGLLKKEPRSETEITRFLVSPLG